MSFFEAWLAVTIAFANGTACGAGVRAKPAPGNLPEIY